MEDIVQAHMARLLAVFESWRKAAAANLLLPFRMLAINVAGNSSANVPIIRAEALASRNFMPYSLIHYVTKNSSSYVFHRATCVLSLINTKGHILFIFFVLQQSPPPFEIPFAL
jgi:hypothetical protein